MAENSSIQGLNVTQQANGYSNSSGDALDRVTSPDFDTQLDLWANMGFTSEEPFFSAERDTASRSRHKKANSSISTDASKERKALSSAAASTSQAGHDGLTGTGNTDSLHDPLASLSSLLANPALLAAAQQQAAGRFNPFMFPWPTASGTSNSSDSANFDSLLSGFPVDPFLVPPAAVAPFAQSFGTAQPSSFPPLTVRQSEETSPKTPASSTSGGIFAIDPALALAPVLASSPRPARDVSAAPTAAPPAKRQKTSSTATTKKSTSTDSPIAEPPVDENKSQSAPRQMTPLTAAEDKRRRNTAASARFRAKKKEREAAMERRAKELEERVTELERECESLRKENGWLKGLVVGATTGDGVDIGSLEHVFNAVKAAASPAVVAPAPAPEEKIGSKRKRASA